MDYLVCMPVCSVSHVQLFATPWNSSPPGSSVHTAVGYHFLLQEIAWDSVVILTILIPPVNMERDIFPFLWLNFLTWNQSVVPCPVLIAASWPAYRFLRRQLRWSVIYIFLRIFHFVVIHRVKAFGIVNKTEVDVFLELQCFLMIQWMLAISSLVPLPFLNPA